MKCEYCGNNLGIEDAGCPYCGKENRFVKKHMGDMRKYSADYESTRKEVLGNSRKFNNMTVRITVIAVLVALIAATAVARTQSYEIRDAREERQVAKHADEYRVKLDKLIAERDYLGVFYYCQANRITFSDTLSEYYYIAESSRSYNSFMEYMDYLLDEDGFMETSEGVRNIEEIFTRIYGYKNPGDWERERYYNDTVTAYINDLYDHTEILVKGYFNLTDEEMESFWELSEAKRQILMEEGYEKKRGK